jgi:hypothetical protein
VSTNCEGPASSVRRTGRRAARGARRKPMARHAAAQADQINAMAMK